MRIESYSFGRIKVDGSIYENDLIVYPDRVEPEWWREEGHSLCPEDLKTIVEYEPDTLVIGTGDQGRMTVPPGTESFLKEKGITVVSGPTEKMSRLFNEKVDHNEKVAGAFHLTC
ncbi:MAG: hypothetical protein GF392_04100 [Candidatus Omnitrophica bacterium]|nr:hypothetical protein [Candidatus Omnitrophota bacterium]